jgi:hypothetical protein
LRHEELVRHDLHRLREIQRAEFGARRNVDQELAGEDLLVGEAGGLVAEDEATSPSSAIALAAALRASSTCGDHSRGRADMANAATQSQWHPRATSRG